MKDVEVYKNGRSLEKIKKVIIEIANKHGIEIDKIILFGSRARGDFKEESDLDLLIITKDELDESKKYSFIYKVRKEIIWKIDLPVDVIVVDKDYFNSYKNVYGSIVGMAALEGIAI